MCLCFFQAEDGIRDLVRSRGLGDVYKRQRVSHATWPGPRERSLHGRALGTRQHRLYDHVGNARRASCLLYTSDAADERSSVDLGGRRIIKKKQSSQLADRGIDTEEEKQQTHESNKHPYTL